MPEAILQRNDYITFPKVPYELRSSFENAVSRTMLPHLSGTQTKMLFWIMTRSLGWNKQGFVLQSSEFTNGSNGVNSAGISRRAVLPALKKLEEFGLVYSTTRNKIRFIWVNLAFDPTKFMSDTFSDISKRRKEYLAKLSEYGVTVFNTATEAVSYFVNLTYETATALYIRTPKKRSKQLQDEQPSEYDGFEEPDDTPPKPRTRKRTVSEIVETASDEELAARITPKPRKRKRVSKPSGGISRYEESWRKGVKEFFNKPDYPVPAWGGKEKGQAKNIARRLEADMSEDEIAELLHYCAKRWRKIMNRYFSFMTGEYLNTPKLGFVLKNITQFSAFYTNATDDSLSNLERVKRVAGAGGSNDGQPKQSNDNKSKTHREVTDAMFKTYERLSLHIDQLETSSDEFLRLPKWMREKLELKKRIQENHRAPIVIEHEEQGYSGGVNFDDDDFDQEGIDYVPRDKFGRPIFKGLS